MTYLELSGCDEIDGWFSQRVTIREMPTGPIKVMSCKEITGLQSWVSATGETVYENDKAILTMILQYPVVAFEELLAEGSQIGTAAIEYADDPEFIVLLAMIHRLKKLMGVRFVCCNQW